MTDTATVEFAGAQRGFLARSKMLDMYAGDIARMLTDGKFLSAETTALSIPHIGVALGDATLQSSCEAYRNWCAQWVRPPLGDPVYEDWCRRTSESEGSSAQSVPFAALQALRLRRNAREMPVPTLEAPLAAESNERSAAEVSCALLRAVRRWYEQEGRYEPTVQTNLARLGVLR